jgi:hypothetical protein
MAEKRYTGRATLDEREEHPIKRQLRTVSKLSDSVHRRLSMYAVAASAAGVGVLALASPAEAKIVYTRAHHVIGTGSSYNLDLNHDGTDDFTLRNKTYLTDSGGAVSFLVRPAKGNLVEAYKPNSWYPWAVALTPGKSIGSKQRFRLGRATMARSFHFYGGNSGRSGYWNDVASRYLGLKFKIGGRTHYGWARLSGSSR